ncbi:MAG: metallophosphoesterase family protein [Nanoarchaeota archaeon]|nr:metallophosphoesterase family protein [Nanoarchaeota archaeon]
MKILAFTDSHSDIESLKIIEKKSADADLIICLGDISWFEEGMEEMLKHINELPRPVLLLHGNHERLKELKKAAQPYSNITVSHEEVQAIGNYDFLTYGGDGFSRMDPEFESIKMHFKKQMRDPKKTILLLHGPPYNTNLDVPFQEYHSGSLSFRAFIEEEQPALVLAGHIHECEGQVDSIKDSVLMNPGMYGELIDLENISILLER